MAESEEQLKSLLMKVKEESENFGLKYSIQKTKVMTSGPITSWQINAETMETVTDFIFCHKDGAICLSEVIEISPRNLDSSLCFIQPGILHDVLCL